MSLNINKQGQFLETNLNEYHIEPDGSIWEHVFHHNNPANNKFASSDTFASGVYKNANAWFNFQICNELTSWEILLIQNKENYSPIQKFRWIQQANPLTATYNDVTADSITRISTTGYTTCSWGGLYKKNSSTYLCANNGNSSNWWGAIGAWGSYQGGIPCWNGITPITGCVDVYIRVDNIIRNAKFYKNKLQICNNFYEY